MGSRLPDRANLPWLILLALAILVGAFLRWYQLGDQILIDDEWHAIHKLLHAGSGDIATHFGFADYSIPLTLYFRFLYDHGGLSEWGMRLPMLLAGIALLIAAPLSLRATVALPARAIWTALLAISPLLVYLSKTARPYALTSLLTFVAITAFRHWWAQPQGRWRWGSAYVVATFLAGYLHLITLPFTLLPFVYYGVPALRDAFNQHTRSEALTALRRLTLLGIATVLLLAVALLPPLLTDTAVLTAKTGTDAVTPQTLYRSLLVMFGLSSPALGVGCAILLAVGVRRLWRRDMDLAGYLLVVMLGGAAAVALAKPAWVQHPVTFARYILPALPFLLLFVAAGAAAILERLRAAPVQAGTAAAALAGMLVIGPIPGYLYNPNQFMGHPRFQFDYDPAYNPYLTLLPADPVPEFYRRLATKPARSLTLIEAPWSFVSDNNPHPWYQEIHRQMIKIGLVTPICGVRHYGEYAEGDKGMALTQFAHLSRMLRGDTYGADYLVIHLRPWTLPPDTPIEWPDMTSCLRLVERRFGSAVYRDDQIVAYALKPASRRGMPQPRGPVGAKPGG